MWPWVVLLALPLLAHAPELTGLVSGNPIYFAAGLTSGPSGAALVGLPGWNDPNTGVTTQALGGLAARLWLHGQVPWWNAYSGVGLPLAAEMQNSALFLPFVLLLKFADGILYLKICMQMLAGLASFALLRQLGFGRGIALAGGVLFELNGTFAWMGHAPIMPVAFLPLLLLGLERARAQAVGARWGGWSWISVGIAGSLYAGFPETAFIDGLMAGVWSVYRLVSAPAGARWQLAGNVACGGGVGLLLAMPVLLPFLELLPQSYTGLHGHVALGLDPANFAMFLFPYVLGTIDYDDRWVTWGAAGGFVGLGLACVASLALARRGREYGLRVVLAVWIVLALGRSAALPGVSAVFDAVPFVRDSWFGRYAVPSWELAAVLLCAWALEDWRRGLRLGWPARVGALGGWVCVGAVALQRAWPTIALLLRERPHYPVYLATAVVLGLGTAALCLWLAGRVWTRARAGLVVGVLVAEALVFSMAPLLSGARGAHYDTGAVHFLQANLGLSRFYTLGPFGPNYGALFGTASINHNYLPTPRRWVDYVRAHLDPGADDVSFDGMFGYTVAGAATRAEALRRRLPAFAAVGVKYIVTVSGENPFLDVAGGAALTDQGVAQPLLAGQGIAGVVPAGDFRPGAVDGVTVPVGTYFGTADGVLAVRLCARLQCVDGAAPLQGAVDNGALPILTTAKLDVPAGEDVQYSITHMGGTRGVAVYLFQSSQGRKAALLDTPSGPKAGYAPNVRIVYAPDRPRPSLVYRDQVMDIYQVADTADYFGVRGGACSAAPEGRMVVRTDCTAPGSLVRRELFFPGWRARVNGVDAKIDVADGIFQSVAVPDGMAEVRFAYAPPFIGWAYAAFGLGVLGVMVEKGRCSFLKKRTKKLLTV
jgi:hypothetical protein